MTPLVKVAMPDRTGLMRALENVLFSGMIAEGEAVYEFERQFAGTFGLSNTLAMSSGTAALHSALTLAGVGAGDEVITTPMTAEPTNLAILHVGAKPIWADIDPRDGTMDPNSIENLITSRTRAIMVVHYGGYPCRMNSILEISKKHNIPVIEDCAHALGATYEGKPIGSLGSFGIFSFQAIKHMNTVDGGALVFQDKTLTDDAKRFRWFGMLKGVPRTEVDIKAVGYKYNMHNVAATIGLEQLREISALVSRHIANGKFFDQALSGISGLSPAIFDPLAGPSYWIYTLLSDDSEDVQRKLAEVDVQASKLHKPNNTHTLFRDSARTLPGLSQFYEKLVHIPCGWWVNEEIREKIVQTLAKG